jgi:hypothetical protein
MAAVSGLPTSAGSEWRRLRSTGRMHEWMKGGVKRLGLASMRLSYGRGTARSPPRAGVGVLTLHASIVVLVGSRDRSAVWFRSRAYK